MEFLQMREMAIQLAGMGYVIFPIMEDTKHGACIPWKMHSTCDGAIIRDWWDEYPSDNVGINCAKSGLLVVDLDNEEAACIWDELWNRRETTSWDSGRYPLVQTPRGWHVYFDSGRKRLRNTTGKLGPGIDSRGSGGMVLGPGSVVNGKPYLLRGGDLRNVPPAPAWLAEKLTEDVWYAERKRKRTTWQEPNPFKAERALLRWCSKIREAPDGEQNHRINTAAYILSRDYIPPLDRDHVRHELEIAAEMGNHPYARAKATIRSGLGV